MFYRDTSPLISIHFEIFQVMGDPKILLGRMEVTFTLVCFLLAAYMTITQIVRYLENRDASSISYKQFSQTPRDRYPTFSICFQGAELYWYYDTLIFKDFGITPAQYEPILKGEIGFKYEYEYTTRLYRKVPIDIRNVSNIGFQQQLYLNLSDILVGLEFVTKEAKNTIRYGNGEKGKLIQQLPFYIGYQTSDTICFTRKSNDDFRLVRVHDWLSLKTSVMENGMYDDVELQIFVHYPGQLLRSFENPSFRSSFNVYQVWKLLELKISHVTVLRKRPDSNVPCNNEVEDDDAYLQLEIIKLVGCIPSYWRHIVPKDLRFDECKLPAELKDAEHYIKNYRDILLSYAPPCVDMTVLVMHKQTVMNKEGESRIKFLYTERHYQEIENVREFGFESFWSAVGGFVGIFVGYSVSQFPELLKAIPSLFRKLKNS